MSKKNGSKKNKAEATPHNGNTQSETMQRNDEIAGEIDIEHGQEQTGENIIQEQTDGQSAPQAPATHEAIETLSTETVCVAPDADVSKKKRIRSHILVFAAFTLLVCAIGGLLIAKKLQRDEALRQSIIQSSTFHDGIVINGIDVGGRSMAEAQALVEQSNHALLEDISFFLTCDGQQYLVDAGAFGFTFDTTEVLQDAFRIARSGTLRDIQTELLDMQANKRQYFTTAQPATQAIEAFISTLAKEVDQPAQNAAFKILLPDDNASEEEKKKEAYVTMAATRTPEQCYAYTAHEDGKQIDQSALAAALLEMANTRMFKDMELPMQRIEAEETLEQVQGTVTMRGSAYTSFAKSPYNRSTRVFNIKKAVGLINGTVLLPGETFSTNDTLGNRTYSGGWKPAPAIVRGRTEDQAGGGVCQVSSTLYNCVLKSDLEIIYRQGHSGKLSYVDGGLDATIDSGRIDFQFRNNTDAPVYIFGYVNEADKTLHFEIHGVPFPDAFDEIQLSSKKVSGLSPSGSIQYTVDYSKPVGYSKVYVARKSGSIWESYKTYLKNGEIIKKETIDRTTYKAYAGETIVGPSSAAAYNPN